MKIKPFLKLMLSIVTDAKIYISRVVSWLSIGNSLMLIFLFLSSLSNQGIIKIDLGKFYLIVITLWFGFLVILGWLEVNKARAPHVEAEKMLRLNPPAQRAYLQIDKIYEKMEKMDDNIKNVKDNYAQQKLKPLKGRNSESNRYADEILDKDKTAENYGQQKQVKQVPRGNPSESKASPDNVGVNEEGKK